MRRFSRIVFNALSVLSLVLAVLIVCAWAAADGKHGNIGYVRRTTCVGFSWRDGALSLLYEERRPLFTLAPGRHLYGSRGGFTSWTDAPERRRTGWEWSSVPDRDLGVLTMTAPLALTIALALPVAWGLHRWGTRWWKRHRTMSGHCVTCGYDLRATRDRCPECGTIAKPP